MYLTLQPKLDCSIDPSSNPSMAVGMHLIQFLMITSSNGNIFRVTGHLCGEFTGHRWIPRTKASDAELWFFYLRLNKRLSKELCCRWFEKPLRPLWRHCNVVFNATYLFYSLALKTAYGTKKLDDASCIKLKYKHCPSVSQLISVSNIELVSFAIQMLKVISFQKACRQSRIIVSSMSHRLYIFSLFSIAVISIKQCGIIAFPFLLLYHCDLNI